MMETRILLAADADFEARLRSAVPELNGNLVRWVGPLAELEAHGVQELVATSPEIVAFGPGLAIDSVLAVAADLDRVRPDIEIMIVAERSPMLWERVARAGVRELVPPSAGDDELADALRRAAATVTARRGHAPASPANPPTAEVPRRVIVLRSPKGGSGKTMLATNMAVALAKRHPGQVALVDLDLQFGDVESALGLRAEHTIADAAANEELTATGLKALLATHESHAHVLCAPHQPAEADAITGDDVTVILELLQTAFHYVIVDTAGGLDEHTLAALESATDVVMVCSMDVSSVRALRKEIDALDAVGLTQSNRHLVLNRANSRVGLEERDIQDTIGIKVDVRISSSRSVPLNMNCGVPVVEAEPAAPVSKQLRQLVERLAPAPATRPSRRWRWSR